jgi:excisionase family DNA binding protein
MSATELISVPHEPDRTDLQAFERIRKYLNVSRSTLLRYIYDRKIEAIRMDGGWRFRWEAVERFVQRRTQKAA